MQQDIFLYSVWYLEHNANIEITTRSGNYQILISTLKKCKISGNFMSIVFFTFFIRMSLLSPLKTKRLSVVHNLIQVGSTGIYDEFIYVLLMVISIWLTVITFQFSDSTLHFHTILSNRSFLI